jgi:retron-type reverse transcriptase
MEAVVARENLLDAYSRVMSNKGAAGIDGMSVEELKPYLQEHWVKIKQDLLKGTYQPQAVRRVEIPKPNGGMRQLGIPMVRSHCTSIQ